MAIIQIRRGITTPTTGSITNIGELAFNYSSNELYIRGSSSMIKVGGSEHELVFNYEAQVSSYKLNYQFDRNYIYKIHIIVATNTTDTSNTEFNYHSFNSSTNAIGAYASMTIANNYSTISKASARSISAFLIHDAYTNSSPATYAVTKVIDFELSPTFESSISNTYTWMAYGNSTTCASDQGNTPITTCSFSHVIDIALGGITMNPGLDGGMNDSFSVSVYRTKRK